MKPKIYMVLLLVVVLGGRLCAQPRHLTIDSCRALALKSNTHLKISSEQQAESDALRRMAASQFFPKATLNGAYSTLDTIAKRLMEEGKLIKS